MRVAAVVLAAGESRRMGQPKQALPWGDTTVLGAVVRAVLASKVGSVTVVLGHHGAEAEAALVGLPVRAVRNPHPEEGMLSSVQCGLAAAGEADAYLFAPGDQPALPAEVIDALLETADGAKQGVVVPTFGGRRGHPVLFRARWRDAILALPQTVGLNHLLHAHPDEVLEVPVDSDAVLQDIDTPADYGRAGGGRP